MYVSSEPVLDIKLPKKNKTSEYYKINIHQIKIEIK